MKLYASCMTCLLEGGGTVSNPDIAYQLKLSLPTVTQNTKELLDMGLIQDLPFSYIEKYFSYPCFFLNDANAGAYGEGIRAGNKKGFFYLSLSNTVGGAYFSEGKLLYGTEFRCGEVGHMTLVPDGKSCYCGKKGCLDAYCAAGNLAQMAEGKLEKYFEGLKQRNPEYQKAWETYRDYLAIAVNNIHMLLDCNIILGGYVGSYLGDHIGEIRQEVGKRNIFSEKGEFVRECQYKIGAAAFGAALYVVEEFLEQI